MSDSIDLSAAISKQLDKLIHQRLQAALAGDDNRSERRAAQGPNPRQAKKAKKPKKTKSSRPLQLDDSDNDKLAAEANGPAVQPVTQLVNGGPGGEPASVTAWSQNNPCYLCLRFGCVARRHGNGSWDNATKHRWEQHRAIWTAVRGFMQMGLSLHDAAHRLQIDVQGLNKLKGQKLASEIVLRAGGLGAWPEEAAVVPDNTSNSLRMHPTLQPVANSTTTVTDDAQPMDHSAADNEAPAATRGSRVRGPRRRRKADTASSPSGASADMAPATQGFVPPPPTFAAPSFDFGPSAPPTTSAPPAAPVKPRLIKRVVRPEHSHGDGQTAPSTPCPLEGRIVKVEHDITALKGSVAQLETKSSVSMALQVRALMAANVPQEEIDQIVLSETQRHQGQVPAPTVGSSLSPLSGGLPPNPAPPSPDPADESPSQDLLGVGSDGSPASVDDARTDGPKRAFCSSDLDDDPEAKPVSVYKLEDLLSRICLSVGVDSPPQAISRKIDCVHLLSHAKPDVGLWAVVQVPDWLAFFATPSPDIHGNPAAGASSSPGSPASPAPPASIPEPPAATTPPKPKHAWVVRQARSLGTSEVDGKVLVCHEFLPQTKPDWGKAPRAPRPSADEVGRWYVHMDHLFFSREQAQLCCDTLNPPGERARTTP